jgi:hypothetical protein
MANGGEILLCRLWLGDIIGEIGFITGEARSATVKALRNRELFRISTRTSGRLLRARRACFWTYAQPLYVDFTTLSLRRRRHSDPAHSASYRPNATTADIRRPLRPHTESFQCDDKGLLGGGRGSNLMTSAQKYLYILARGQGGVYCCKAISPTSYRGRNEHRPDTAGHGA